MRLNVNFDGAGYSAYHFFSWIFLKELFYGVEFFTFVINFNNITDHDTNNTLNHEAYWILYAINTRATISPESCDGKFCPFKSYEGLGFSADLMVNKTLPAVSDYNIYSN